MLTRAGICSMCGKEFKNVSQYMINVNKENEVPCEVCHKTFKSVMLKIKHVIKVHGKYSQTFSSNSYLRAHIQNVHSQESKENQFSCIYCGNLYKNQKGLKIHMKKCSEK